MADDEEKSSGQPGRAGRRRPAPTIELTATEVQADQADQAAPSPEPAAEATAPPEAEAEAEPLADGGAPPPETAEPSPPRPAASLWPMLGAAAGGAAVVIVLLLLLWGVPPGNDALDRQVARIADLEAKVQKLAAPRPSTGAVPHTVASLADRVAQLEATRNATPPSANPQLENRLAAVEKHIASLSDTTAALKQRSDAAMTTAESAQQRADAAAAKVETVQSAEARDTGADRQQIASLSDRMAALERTAQALQKDLSQQQAAIAEQQAVLAKQRDARAEERAVRLAVVAETLKAAVARGERFRAALDAAKALAPAADNLAPLEGFADGGVPTSAALTQQLRAILPAMRRAAQPKVAADGGFWDRLQANAEKLVRIRPVGERPGNDPGAILARIAVKLDRGDIAGILDEMKMLPPAVRAPAQDWIKTAKARDVAIAASRAFAAAHIGALAGRSD